MNPKQEVLAQYLEVEADTLDTSKGDNSCISDGAREYLVLTVEEADERARAHIEESLWAFNADFIAAHTVNGLNNAARKALGKAQAELCEDANDLVRALIHDFDHFVEDAIRADGRGHFLAQYDCEEHEVKHGGTNFYVYRRN
jgi:hypothetical protein